MNKDFEGGGWRDIVEKEQHKQIKVLIQLSITNEGKPQFTKMIVVDDVKSSTINAIAKENISQGSTITSDDFKSYKRLQNEGFDHNSITMKDVGNDSAPLWFHTVIPNEKAYILGTCHGLDKIFK